VADTCQLEAARTCDAFQEEISRRDGRIVLPRRLRAHLGACAECRRFRARIDERKLDLAALAPPLAAGASAPLLHRLRAWHSAWPEGP
jgi:hypothetical protein